MKVLVLTPGVFDKGGISRYCRFQIRALRERYGTESIRVLSKLGPDEHSFEETLKVSWSGHPNPGLATRVLFSLQALRCALRDRPDVVLTGHVNLGPLGRVVASQARALLVQNIYGTEIWTGLSGRRKTALQQAQAVISDCHNTADLSVEMGLRSQKPAVVWDCVDTDRYTPGPPDPAILESYGIPRGERFRLLFLGRLTPDARYKGTERLLRLLTTLPSTFECVLAGGGDDLEHLCSLAERLALGNRVYFPGRINERHLPDVYRSADAFYLVSEFGYNKGEGLPLTPIEAMACGVPVIVGNQDGSREILDGFGGGVCISPNAQQPAVKYLESLAVNPNRLAVEREAARRRVDSAFRFQLFARQTVAVFEGLLHQMGKR